MQNDIKNTNQRDVFSNSIRQKLENHQLPVDAECWNEIEAKMNANKKKKIIPFWWLFSGGAAVATFALLFMLRTTNNTTNFASKIVNKNIVQKEAAAINKAEANPTNQTVLTYKKQTKNSHTKKQTSTIQEQKTIIGVETNHAETVQRDSTNKSNIVNTLENTIITNDETAQVTFEVTDSVTSTSKKKYISNNLVEQPSHNKPIAKIPNRNGWLLAAAFGSGGSTSLSGQNDFLPYALGDKNLTSANTNYTNIMAPNDFSEKNFRAPLSFGITIRKTLNTIFSIETGLAYTYLLSTFEETGINSYDANLSLHYLGIPINLVAQLWKANKWEVYLSGGGMIEKGLRSVYVQNQYIGNQTITTSVSTNINGFQWSVNAGIGGIYELQHNIGIYFEPKFSYFFNNNQPISARTDQPVVLGLTAGIRYHFK